MFEIFITRISNYSKKKTKLLKFTKTDPKQTYFPNSYTKINDKDNPTIPVITYRQENKL